MVSCIFCYCVCISLLRILCVPHVLPACYLAATCLHECASEPQPGSCHTALNPHHQWLLRRPVDSFDPVTLAHPCCQGLDRYFVMSMLLTVFAGKEAVPVDMQSMDLPSPAHSFCRFSLPPPLLLLLKYFPTSHQITSPDMRKFYLYQDGFLPTETQCRTRYGKPVTGKKISCWRIQAILVTSPQLSRFTDSLNGS